MYTLDQFLNAVDKILTSKFGFTTDDFPSFDWKAFYKEEPEVADPDYAVQCFLEEIK